MNWPRIRGALPIVGGLFTCVLAGRVAGWATYLLFDSLQDGVPKLALAALLLPFEFVGMVFGNIHLGNRRISELSLSIALAATLFGLWRRRVRVR